MVLQNSQNRRSSQRIPLSNLTNTQSVSSSSSSKFSINPKPKFSDPVSSISSNSNLKAVSAKSSSRNPRNRRFPSLDCSVLEAVNYGKSKPYIVNARGSTEGSKDKAKATTEAVASSCPPREWMSSAINNLKAEHRDTSLFGTFSVPHMKSKKINEQIMVEDKVLKNYSMPLEYIIKQRAYYAEIDAFKLAEEIVSESESE